MLDVTGEASTTWINNMRRLVGEYSVLNIWIFQRIKTFERHIKPLKDAHALYEACWVVRLDGATSLEGFLKAWGRTMMTWGKLSCCGHDRIADGKLKYICACGFYSRPFLFMLACFYRFTLWHKNLIAPSHWITSAWTPSLSRESGYICGLNIKDLLYKADCWRCV